MKKGIAEILQEVDRAPTVNDKIRLLQENYSRTLVDILQGAFDPRIKWLLPAGEVPYNPSKLKDLEHVLYNRARELYLFVQGGNDNLSQVKREALFIQFLESLNPEDAHLIATIKDKKLPYSSITPEIVVQAFPNAGIMIPESTPTEVPQPEKRKRGRPPKVTVNV